LSLLFERRFGPLFATQFCGALNDNLFKNALIVMIAYAGRPFFGLEPALLVNAIAAIFILPFLLFSVTAGECADKWDKARVTRVIKLLEIALMAVGAVALVFQNMAIILVVIFLLGCHSTFFGPIKFAILPQHLPQRMLAIGNGWVEMGTFVAILLGTNLGAILMSLGEAGQRIVAALTLVIALTGYAASRAIPSAPSTVPGLRFSRNPLGEAWRSLSMASKDRVVLAAMLGNSWFWFYGATFLTQFPAYSRDTLGGSESVVTLLWTVLTLAVGSGSLLCARLSSGRLGFSTALLGGLGMTFFAMDLATAHETVALPGSYGAAAFLQTFRGLHVAADTALLGVSAGFFIVPLYVLIQSRTPESHRARMMGTTNLLNALFMVVSAVMAMLFLAGGRRTIPELFLWTGVVNALAIAGLVMACPLLLEGFLRKAKKG
jgi:MFS family permease